MNDLEQAARQALKALEVATTPLAKDRQEVLEAIASLRQALEQKQEHYDQTALELCELCGWKTLIPGDCCLNCERTAAQQNQEPVAWISKQSLAEIKDFDATVYSRGGFDDAAPLYTESPKREWVGLTDSERLEAAEIDGADEWFWKVCKALEAKLKEKNT